MVSRRVVWVQWLSCKESIFVFTRAMMIIVVRPRSLGDGLISVSRYWCFH